MARRRHEEEPDNHDRWMVSYADLVTLLFAFFVVMYALSSVNEHKYRVLADSLVSAFGKPGSPAPVVVEPMQPASPVPLPLPSSSSPEKKQASEAFAREKQHMTRIARDVLDVLAPLVNEGKVRVTQTDSGVTVEINASVLFAPGDARLAAETSVALRQVAAVLRDDFRTIQVEGHTDSVPINTPLFPSNWELSAVRASSVVRLFIDAGVGEHRLTAIGRGATRPVADNESPEGRVRNRRVTLLILSDLPEKVTEVPVAAVP